MDTNQLEKSQPNFYQSEVVGGESPKNGPKSARKHPSGLETGIMMISIALGNTGFYSFVDSPASLAEPLIRFLDITPQEIGLLNSFSTAFAIVMSPAAGVLITRFGIARVAVFFNSTVMAGIFISFFGIMLKSFKILLLGRIVYGFGGTPNVISTASASSKWFSGRFLSISMGLNMFFGLIGASLSNYINPANVVKYRNLQVAFAYYALISTISWTATMIFSYLDFKNQNLRENGPNFRSKGKGPEGAKMARKESKDEQNYSRMTRGTGTDNKNHHNTTNKENTHLADDFLQSEQLNIEDYIQKAAQSSENPHSHQEPDFGYSEDFTKLLTTKKSNSVTTAKKIEAIRTLQQKLMQKQSQAASPPIKYKFRVSHLKKFGLLYFCCLLTFGILSNSYYQFSFIISDFMIHRFSYTYLASKNFLPIIQILTATLTTLTSLVTSRVGRKLKFMLLGVCLLIASYLNLLFCQNEPSLRVWISVVLIGVFLGFYQSTIWPCAALCLPSEVVSVGLGILSFFQAALLSPLAYLFGGVIKQQRARDYDVVLGLLIGMAGLGMVVVILAIYLDSAGERILDRPENDLEVGLVRREMDASFRDFYTFEYLMKKHFDGVGRRKKGRSGRKVVRASGDGGGGGHTTANLAETLY